MSGKINIQILKVLQISARKLFLSNAIRNISMNLRKTRKRIFKKYFKQCFLCRVLKAKTQTVACTVLFTFYLFFFIFPCLNIKADLDNRDTFIKKTKLILIKIFLRRIFSFYAIRTFLHPPPHFTPIPANIRTKMRF